MLKKLTIVMGMAVAVAGMTTVSSIGFAPEAQALGWKTVKKAGKKVGRKVKKTTKTAGRGIKKGAKFTGRKAKKAGKAVYRVGKEVGGGFKGMAKCAAKSSCRFKGQIGDLPNRNPPRIGSRAEYNPSMGSQAQYQRR